MIFDFFKNWGNRKVAKNSNYFSGGSLSNSGLNLFSSLFPSGRTYSQAVKHAFFNNYVVYKAVTAIAEGVSAVKFNTEDMDLENILNNPSEGVSYKWFMYMACVHKLLAGHAIFNGNVSEETIFFIKLVRPDRFDYETGIFKGLPDQVTRYTVTIEGRQIVFLPEENKIFLSKFYNPLNDHVGLSRIGSVMLNIQSANEMTLTNFETIKNKGIPKAIFKLKSDKDSPSATPEEVISFNTQIQEKFLKTDRSFFATSANFDLLKLGMTVQELDYASSKNVSAREIALALGYPPFLLGMAEGATFNNVSEAKLELWESSIIPIAEGLLDDFVTYYNLITGSKSAIELNLEGISALRSSVEMRRKGAIEEIKEGLITTEEYRVRFGYPSEPEEGELLIPSNRLPLGIKDM